MKLCKGFIFKPELICGTQAFYDIKEEGNFLLFDDVAYDLDGRSYSIINRVKGRLDFRNKSVPSVGDKYVIDLEVISFSSLKLKDKLKYIKINLQVKQQDKQKHLIK